MRGLWAKYQTALVSNPLPTKARTTPPHSNQIYYHRLLHARRVCRISPQGATSAFISGAGDMAAQLAIEKKETLDTKRFAIFTTLGGFLVAPALHNWYNALNRNFPGSSFVPIVKRILADQILFAPIFLPVFMGSMLLLEGKPDPIGEISRSYWSILIANWSIWTPVSTVNFALVPPHFQVLFANSFSFIWNSYLSWYTHKRKVTTSVSD